MDRSAFDAKVNAFLGEAMVCIPATKLPPLPPLAEAPKVPAWYQFESDVWDIGEKIRLLIVSEHKSLNSMQVEQILKI